MKTTMTNELPDEIMENGIHYTLVSDYYFPTCMLGDKSPNGKWASLYECYLQEKHPHEYVRLIWADELAALLESVQKECEERVAVLVREMAEVEGVDEEMKENEQMEWVKNQAVNDIIIMENRARRLVLCLQERAKRSLLCAALPRNI